MNCMRCGADMSTTTGGNYYCTQCGLSINDLVYRPANCDMPIPQGFGEEKGWICPVCGRGLAPWVSCCPCMSNGLEITYGTDTTLLSNIPSELERLFTLNDERIKEMENFYEKYGSKV